MKDNLEEKEETHEDIIKDSQESINEMQQRMSPRMLKFIIYLMVTGGNLFHTILMMIPALLIFGLVAWKIVLVNAVFMFAYLMYKTIHNNSVLKLLN